MGAVEARVSMTVDAPLGIVIESTVLQGKVSSEWLLYG